LIGKWTTTADVDLLICIATAGIDRSKFTVKF
jgi:hypothetical protein